MTSPYGVDLLGRSATFAIWPLAPCLDPVTGEGEKPLAAARELVGHPVRGPDGPGATDFAGA